MPKMPSMPTTGPGKWIKDAVSEVHKEVIEESVDGQKAAPYVSPSTCYASAPYHVSHPVHAARYVPAKC